MCIYIYICVSPSYDETVCFSSHDETISIASVLSSCDEKKAQEALAKLMRKSVIAML